MEPPFIIDDSMQEYDDLVDQIDAHRILISPIRRLPPELLQEIFIRCLPTKRNAVMSSREAPVLLGRVCGGWRRIALSTPRLWSSLHIVSPNEGSTSHEKFSQRFDCLNIWLGLSGALPLSISLVTPEHPQENACKIITSLIPFSRRWKSIDLCVPRIALDSLFDLTKEDVPILEMIKLQHSNFDELPSREAEMAVLGAPRLRSASLPNSHINPLELPLSWAQLTELCLSSDFLTTLRCAFPPALALCLLSQCPKLVSCTLEIATGTWFSTPDWTPPNELVILPLLQSFNLGGLGVGSLLDRLILPELRDISMSELKSGTLEHTAFRSLLARSHSLGSIALMDSYLKSEDLIECLQLTPSLTRLHLADLGRADKPQNTLLHLLTPTQESPGLCPALEIIEFVKCSVFSDEALLRFLQARLARVHPDVARLRRVEVLYTCSMELDILSQIQPLIEAGTEVSLISPPKRSRGPDSPWKGLLHELPPLY